MIIIIIILILIPVMWFMELIYKMTLLEEALELFFSTTFFMLVPSLALGDLTNWNIDAIYLGMFLGFATSSTFHKWIEY